MDQSFKEIAYCVYYIKDLCKLMCTIEFDIIICVIPVFCRQDTSMMYTALCSYTREYKNFWTTNIMIMKHLKAHFKVLIIFIHHLLCLIF